MRAVLFDLDGTLLDVDTDRFMERYFAALKRVRVPGFDGDIFAAVVEGTRVMMRPHEGVTNEDAFWGRFSEVTGGPKADFEPHFARFYEDVFPTLREGAGPCPQRPRGRSRRRWTWAWASPSQRIRCSPGWRSTIGSPGRAFPTSRPGCTSRPTRRRRRASRSPATSRRPPRPSERVPRNASWSVTTPRWTCRRRRPGMRTFYVGPDRHAAADERGTLGDLAEMLGERCERGPVPLRARACTTWA